jgi:hypothetical protein
VPTIASVASIKNENCVQSGIPDPTLASTIGGMRGGDVLARASTVDGPVRTDARPLLADIARYPREE